MILTHQRAPKSLEAFEAVLESIVKNIRGKSSDDVPYTILTVSRSPLTLQQSNIFAIEKHHCKDTDKHSYQIIWNGRDGLGRTVYHPDDVSITVAPHGGLRMILREPSPSRQTWADKVNVAFNSLQMNKDTYQVTSTKYTEVRSLRDIMSKWGKSLVTSWLDLSSGYNHGKSSALMQEFTGFGVPGTDIHVKIHSYTFDSSLSCVSFQTKSCVIVLLCEALWPELFGRHNNNGIIFAYIDDIVCVARNRRIGLRCFNCIKEVLAFLGFKTCPEKISSPNSVNTILGLKLDSLNSAIKCGVDRASSIITMLDEFLDDPAGYPATELDSWLGKLSYLAYQSNFAPNYMIPLYALKWASPANRAWIVKECKSPLAERVRAAFSWWYVLLKGDRILWSATERHVRWYEVGSDASETRFGSVDTYGNICVGDFADLDLADEIIAFKELFAITQHLREFPPPPHSGIRFWCDNLNVVHTINCFVARGGTSEKFKAEFKSFHEFCEHNSITCIASYVKSKFNTFADMISREDCRLAIEMLGWCGISPQEIAASSSLFNELRASKCTCVGPHFQISSRPPEGAADNRHLGAAQGT